MYRVSQKFDGKDDRILTKNLHPATREYRSCSVMALVAHSKRPFESSDGMSMMERMKVWAI